MTTLEQKLEIGKRVLQAAKRMLLGHGLGVTILVHDAVLDPGNLESAAVTTLPTRAHQRVILAHALVGMSIADGGGAEDAAQQVIEDMRALQADVLKARKESS